MTKYEPERDIPVFAREIKSTSPTELAKKVLERRNHEISSQAINHWFDRHPGVREALDAEFIGALPTEKQVVDASIFENGNFENLPSVKNWLMEMSARDLKAGTVKHMTSTLKCICRGIFPVSGIDLIKDGKWCFKHPNRLSMSDALEIIMVLKSYGVDTYRMKRTLKDFLMSKGENVGKKISVGRSSSLGKYAKLKVDMERLVKILEWIKTRNFEAFVIDLFMFKTGTRITASLNAKIEDLTIIGDHAIITVYDKGRRVSKVWEKALDEQLLPEITKLIGDRKSGKVFENITETELSRLNRDALATFAFDVVQKYPDLWSNHFWRHMFAQHELPLNEWNYAKVAARGGWTPQALEESYGGAPPEVRAMWNKEASIESAYKLSTVAIA